jgi:hypothetical protein
MIDRKSGVIMTLNCLGSICAKICESCSFNICNSNRNVLLVGSTDNTELHKRIAANPGLQNIVTQMGGQLGNQLETGITLQTRSVLPLEGENNEIRDIAVRSAIIQTSVRGTFKLMQVNEPFESGWKKFLLAQAECNLNLENMCKEAEPLSQADVNKLDKAIDKVAKYYLSAIYLWKVFCVNGFKTESILRHDQIGKAQVTFIIKQIKGKYRYKDVDNFWNLKIEAQKIFFDGAVKYFKKHIHDYCRVLRTAAFQVIVARAQKSNDNFLHDQVALQANQSPPMGEHKVGEVLQIGMDVAFQDVSSTSFNRGVTGPSSETSPPRLLQSQAQMQGASPPIRHGLVSGTPDVSLRGNKQEHREDSSLLTKEPPSPTSPNAHS